MLAKNIAMLLMGTIAMGSSAVADDKPVIKLWPTGLPAGSTQLPDEQIEQAKAKTTAERIAYVDDPTLTLYRAPADKANGCGVIVCPGGGYNILAWAKEGLEIAEWFNSIGVTAAVLKYRVPRRDPDEPHGEPLQDAQRAIRVVRQHATSWEIDPHRIGILGFSAGGNLAVMAALHFDKDAYKRIDTTDELSCRPDFVMPIYAAYLGDPDDPTRLDSLVRVTKQSPPMFMAVTWDDKWRGLHAALLLAELKKADVPSELHVFSKGGHGYGIRPAKNVASTWNQRCADWLRVSGLLQSGGATK